jgi:hypothetical protein
MFCMQLLNTIERHATPRSCRANPTKRCGGNTGLRFRITWPTTTLILFAAGVLAVPQPALAQKGKGGGNNGGGGGNFESVSVSFRDLASDRIQSDGEGDYYDGEQKVLAVIDSSDGFRFDTGGKKGRRKVWLDFSDQDQTVPGDPWPDDLIPLPGLAGADIRIHDEYYQDGSIWVSLGPLDLIDMSEGESTYVGLTRGPLVKFDPNPPEDAFGTGIASPVIVTRVSAETWVFESLPSHIAASFKVVGSDWNNPISIGRPSRSCACTSSW